VRDNTSSKTPNNTCSEVLRCVQPSLTQCAESIPRSDNILHQRYLITEKSRVKFEWTHSYPKKRLKRTNPSDTIDRGIA
ncbi:hypothetical protein J6590_089988, partial [Homalodisca vitripennis]